MEFFEEGLRETLLTSPQQKLNAQNAKRIKLIFEMALTEESLEGAPSEVKAAFEAVAALSKGIVSTKISTEYDHVTILLHQLPDKAAVIEISDCLLRELRVYRKVAKEGSASECFLHMATTVTYTKKLWAIAGEAGGTTMWVDFQQAQGILSEEDAPAAKDEPTPAKKKGKGAKAASVN